jgi:hypothetical protein
MSHSNAVGVQHCAVSKGIPHEALLLADLFVPESGPSTPAIDPLQPLPDGSHFQIDSKLPVALISCDGDSYAHKRQARKCD